MSTDQRERVRKAICDVIPCNGEGGSPSRCSACKDAADAVLAALPQAQADGWLTDIENAPRDGSDVLFPIEFVARAYWCDDQDRWVLNFPLRMDYVNAPTRYRLPRAQSASLIAEERKG
jgi:hypothetical protein